MKERVNRLELMRRSKIEKLQRMRRALFDFDRTELKNKIGRMSPRTPRLT